MFRSIILLILLSFVEPLFAQAPQAFDLQAVARSSSGEVLPARSIALRIGIVADDSIVYQETHAVTTNAFGLFSVAVGNGTPVTGTFPAIAWGAAAHSLRLEMDADGGTNYQLIGEQQVISVPYALHAANGLPEGGTNGQVLTNCCGMPLWTTGGNCPGTLSVLQCASATTVGTLYEGVPTGGVFFRVPYMGCIGGSHPGQVVASTGVNGLTATLASGSLDQMNGELEYAVAGTPDSAGLASFELSIGGRICTLVLEVLPLEYPFDPGIAYGSDVDQEGNTFLTVTMAGQEWMAENLRVSSYANGDPIPNTTSSFSTGGWAYYNNDPQYEGPYGRLYNWYAVNDPRNICPSGWHVASDDDWNVLVGSLDPGFDPDALAEQSATAGGALKATGTNYWLAPNTGATNTSGFSALPGGIFLGLFAGVGTNCFWWTSTQSSASQAIFRRVDSDDASITRDVTPKDYLMSVRCVRD